LELRPHYYEAGWFKILAGVVTFVLLSLIYGWRMQHLKWRQQRLQRANDLLEAKVNERTAELRRSNASLQNEIEERQRMELEVERVHRQLVDASRQAGQAEVASSVLHNVGNVLNSLNISTSVISDRLRELGLDKLTKAARLLEDHSVDPVRFLGENEKGRLLPRYLAELSRHLTREQEELLLEMKSLGENVDHIKEIVAMQQSYTKAFGLRESSSLQELVESALKMQGAAYRRHAITLVREFEAVPPVLVERHRVLQILVNLLHNAKDACNESGRTDKRVAIRIAPAGGDSVSVSVSDNGIGIRADHLARIFSQGFTTKQHGHGFGLHSAALAAKELGGGLAVSSTGPGWGASFTLTLPLAVKAQTTMDSDLASLQALRLGGGMGEDGIPLESRPASIQLDSPQCSIRSPAGEEL
jgi:two-component system, NtrC family, sensor kinase